jgi:hypothetical protein
MRTRRGENSVACLVFSVKFGNIFSIGAFVVLIILLTAGNIFSQNKIPNFPSESINKFNLEALKRVRSENQKHIYELPGPSFQSSAGTALQWKETLKLPVIHAKENTPAYFRSDTLFIGDTLEISGEWTQNGHIVLYGDGYLRLNHCHATILGDIYLLNNSHFVVDSSSLYIPQAYFYQRAVVATGGSKVKYRNTEVDHSDLSHNILLIDSARLELINVVNKGFTTNGIYHNASVFIDGTNQAGEYVILDEATLEFYNAKTVLLWHQFPENAVVNFDFPDADTVENYQFNESVPGVSGIGYSVLLDNCTEVMWGMMPATGSDITISDSEIRAIGLWFMGSDTINVNGLVNNSYYSDFQAPLDDRQLRLIDCDVTTWSIYPMDQSVVNLSGCIVGEIGAGKRSTLMGSQFFCDGSGGYVWTSDTSFMLAGFSYSSGYVRSQANSILYYAYSSLSGGYLSALQNSVIMAIQCVLPEEPRAYDNSVAWYALIEGPSEAYAGESVDIRGSAWVDKTPTSTLMDFGSYRLYYQQAEATNWTEIPVDSLQEKRRETLGLWNTEGLSTGQYLLRLLLKDDLGNSAEAVKTISLQPSFGIIEKKNDSFLVFPNPANEWITVQFPAGIESCDLRITDVSGRICLEKEIPASNNLTEVTIFLGYLEKGVYQVQFLSEYGILHSDILIKN